MPSYPIPANEPERVAALRRYELLDTSSEQVFDDFAQLASFICGTPTALMTLVDEDRQWFKAKIGLELTETPRDQSFCTHTILSEDLLIVEDATADARFAANPLVTSNPHIRFYAGAPLIDSGGFGLGSLCVIDREPRRLSPEQRHALQLLARQVVALCECRLASADLASALREVRKLRGLLPICSHCKSVKNDEGYWRSLEQYLATRTDADLTHGICPNCLEEHYPGIYKRLRAQGEL